MRNLLTLFDYSRSWPLPFIQNGTSLGEWDVYAFDIKDGLDINDFSCEYLLEEIGIDHVEGIIAAPPCTDFSSSGAQYWGQKDANGKTDRAIDLVYQVLCAVDLYSPEFWVIENPVGRLSKLIPELGKPAYFDPCDYAGYLHPDNKTLSGLEKIRAKNGHGVTKEEVDFIIEQNAYTKKTGLWGDFKIPETKRIEPVKCCPQGSFTQRLGGSSEKTKEARSWTPEGFSLAFYEANKCS